MRVERGWGDKVENVDWESQWSVRIGVNAKEWPSATIGGATLLYFT